MQDLKPLEWLCANFKFYVYMVQIVYLRKSENIKDWKNSTGSHGLLLQNVSFQSFQTWNLMSTSNSL